MSNYKIKVYNFYWADEKHLFYINEDDGNKIKELVKAWNISSVENSQLDDLIDYIRKKGYLIFDIPTEADFDINTDE
ncbi:MAG: hypothetical protein ACYCS1_05275 [Gammaproteobacteria bacterium]